MKVQELVVNINNNGFKLSEALEVKTYIPMALKKVIAQSIIYECTNSEGGVIKVDSVQRYISYIRYMITTHTNLEYTDEDYDTLCSTEYQDTVLLNAVLGSFGDDAQECSRILNLMIDDYMQDMRVEVTIARFLNELGQSLEGLVDKLDLGAIIPDSMDINKLSTFLQKYIK